MKTEWKMAKSFTLIFVSMLSCLTGIMSGCTSEPVVAHSDADKVAVIESLQYSDTGLTAVVTRGDAKITIDLARADRQDMELLRHPEEMESFVSNFRVYNRSDYPFLIIGDGMLTVNPATGQVDIPLPGQIDQQDQLDDLRLVLETIGLLDRHAIVGPRFQTDLKKLGDATDAALANANAVFDGRIPAAPEAAESGNSAPSPESNSTGVGVSSQALSGGTGFIQNFFIKYKQAFWIWGDHSSIKIDVYSSSGTYIGYLSTRNHGNEADEASMMTVPGCPRAFYNRPTTLPPIQPFASTDTFLSGDAGGCSTTYWPYNGFGHVCNDDSLAMLHMAINKATISNDPTCSDLVLRTYAPSCY